MMMGISEWGRYWFCVQDHGHKIVMNNPSRCITGAEMLHINAMRSLLIIAILGVAHVVDNFTGQRA